MFFGFSNHKVTDTKSRARPYESFDFTRSNCLIYKKSGNIV